MNNPLFSAPARAFIRTEETQVDYLTGLLPAAEAALVFQALEREVDWKQESMPLYGRMIDFPRLTAWYGDPGRAYAFSGIQLQPKHWSPLLIKIKTAVEQQTLCQFNSVLLNYYRSGKDSISWHTDDEDELGLNPTVASVSFGGSRRFMVRERSSKKAVSEILLEDNSLLIMRGAMMRLYQHQIPKVTRADPRINLTFRTII